MQYVTRYYRTSSSFPNGSKSLLAEISSSLMLITIPYFCFSSFPPRAQCEPFHLTILRQQCEVCRTRKTRCDAKRPCGFCAEAGVECVYRQSAHNEKYNLYRSNCPFFFDGHQFIYSGRLGCRYGWLTAKMLRV